MSRAFRWTPVWNFFLFVGALALFLAFSAVPAGAQAAKLADGPPPPDGTTATDTGNSSDAGAPPDYGAPPATGSSTPANPVPGGPDAVPDGATDALKTPPAPTWDPLHASKSVEVGSFYMKKGDYDAAIDRFEEAARLQPGLAKPYLLLGEVYEKKGDAQSAVTAYRTYLKLYRTAPDRARIEERIERLQNKSKHDAAQTGSG